MKFMEKFQAYTLPIFLLLLILMILSLNLDPRLVSRADGWLTYLPRGASLAAIISLLHLALGSGL